MVRHVAVVSVVLDHVAVVAGEPERVRMTERNVSRRRAVGWVRVEERDAERDELRLAPLAGGDGEQVALNRANQDQRLPAHEIKLQLELVGDERIDILLRNPDLCLDPPAIVFLD